MQFKKTLPYNIKRKFRRAMLTTGLAGATLVGCNKNNIEPTRDVELEFWNEPHSYSYDAISIKNIKKYAKDRSVRTIYLKVRDGSDFSDTGSNGIHVLRNYLQERMEISPKNNGKGKLIFEQGYLPVDDSLWFRANNYDIQIVVRRTKSR